MGIEARIEAVLGVHSLYFPTGDVYYSECGDDGCDWTGVWAEHPAHVASALVEALGLHEEREDRYGNRGPVSYSRWLSRWEKAE